MFIRSNFIIMRWRAACAHERMFIFWNCWTDLD